MPDLGRPGGLGVIVLSLGLGLVGATSVLAAPPGGSEPDPAGEPSAEPPDAAPGPVAPAGPTVDDDLQRFERELAAIGRAYARARQGSDPVRADCLRDKHDRAVQLAELAADELSVARDPGAEAQARELAAQVFGEYAERMSELAAQARVCEGRTTPEDEDDETRTDADEPSLIPWLDPSQGLARPVVPEALSVDWLPLPSPVE